MTNQPDFLWVGNHVALDFVNTLAAGPDGPIELLNSNADLWRWARSSALADDLRLARGAGPDLDPAAPRLRAALLAIFGARIDGGTPPRASLDVVNTVLAAKRAPEQLAWAAGRFRRIRPPIATTVELLQRLADESVRLLDVGPADRLRRCAGAGCVLLFLDVSKSGLRRWCSMDGCGNRSKVRAHYRRARRGS